METNQTKRSMKETAPGKCLRGINITINKFFSLKGLAEKVKEAGQVSQGPGASSRLFLTRLVVSRSIVCLQRENRACFILMHPSALGWEENLAYILQEDGFLAECFAPDSS